MHGDAREAAGRQAGGVLEDHLDVNVQDLQCLLAVDIAGDRRPGTDPARASRS